jgi:serine/threonine protein kinase
MTVPDMAQHRILGRRYELDSIVGRGGMAEVFRARDIRLGRIVAVKTLREDLAADARFQARFRREAQSAASLNYPSIVGVYDTGEDTSGPTPVPYIVMEYVDGVTLRDLLRDNGRMLPERAAEIADGVLQALEYSHHSGIVHFDIKPGNVMLTRNRKVKVMGFGIAKAVSDARADSTDPDMVIGTAQYLSPEQALGKRTDARSDLYSTGCLLYELLTGRPPFLGDSPVAIAYQHVRENPVAPSRLDPEIPTWADSIVLKAMAKEPAQRYQSAAEMRVDIQRALSGIPEVAAAPPVGAVPASSRLSPPRTLPSRPYRPPAVVPVPAPVVLKRPTVVRVSEAPIRRTEMIGDEVRSFNNAKSSSTAVETIKVSNVARVSASVDLSKTRTVSGGAGVRFIDVINVQASLGNELMRHYSLGMDSELIVEQTTEITIPAHTNVEVTFHWFRIWVTGMLTLSEIARRAAEVAEVPFEITVGLSFNKETRDID